MRIDPLNPTALPAPAPAPAPKGKARKPKAAAKPAPPQSKLAKQVANITPALFAHLAETDAASAASLQSRFVSFCETSPETDWRKAWKAFFAAIAPAPTAPPEPPKIIAFPTPSTSAAQRAADFLRSL